MAKLSTYFGCLTEDTASKLEAEIAERRADHAERRRERIRSLVERLD